MVVAREEGEKKKGGEGVVVVAMAGSTFGTMGDEGFSSGALVTGGKKMKEATVISRFLALAECGGDSTGCFSAGFKEKTKKGRPRGLVWRVWCEMEIFNRGTEAALAGYSPEKRMKRELGWKVRR
ncbi:hypothetical protein HAX54_029238 [Datura stramonium]|uniref:Uncharacterized protein n=1 Tax=Datura stramonium TaxID=4076 RepID=A0ABS8SA50_DATST|nr:hypothetical protein [Datura stramonium]